MATAHHAESQVEEFAVELDRWQGRLRNLAHMIPAGEASSRVKMNAGLRQLEVILGSAGELLDRSRTISSEEWMEIHPKITATLRAAQSCYNNLVADWPQS
jgi:hypothetical protein